MLQIDDTTSNVNAVIAQHGSQYDEIYVAAHEGSVNRQNLSRVAASADFSGVREDPLYEALLGFVERPDSGTLARLCKVIKKKPDLDLAQRLSILKHRLAHLFTPIDIDLQGLMATNFREDYWREVVRAYEEIEPSKLVEKAERIKDEFCDEFCKDVNQRQKQRINGVWVQAKEQILEMMPLIEALTGRDMKRCKEQADKFREAFSRFLAIFEELAEELAKSSPETK
jgi:hypothetical protein